MSIIVRSVVDQVTVVSVPLVVLYSARNVSWRIIRVKRQALINSPRILLPLLLQRSGYVVGMVSVSDENIIILHMIGEKTVLLIIRM